MPPPDIAWKNLAMHFMRSNAISLLALFVALGGTSYAVIHLPRGSVGSRELARNSVSSGKVRDRSLRLADLRPSAKRALRGRPGPTGTAGPAGPAGEAGPSEVIVKTFPNGEIHAPSPAMIGSPVSAPPGNYYVRARTNLLQLVDSGINDAEVLECRIDTNKTKGPVLHRYWINAKNNVGDRIEAFAERAVTLTADDPTVFFVCPPNENYHAGYSFENAEIVLQRVGKITQLP